MTKNLSIYDTYTVTMPIHSYDRYFIKKSVKVFWKQKNPWAILFSVVCFGAHRNFWNFLDIVNFSVLVSKLSWVHVLKYTHLPPLPPMKCIFFVKNIFLCGGDRTMADWLAWKKDRDARFPDWLTWIEQWYACANRHAQFGQIQYPFDT